MATVQRNDENGWTLQPSMRKPECAYRAKNTTSLLHGVPLFLIATFCHILIGGGQSYGDEPKSLTQTDIETRLNGKETNAWSIGNKLIIASKVKADQVRLIAMGQMEEMRRFPESDYWVFEQQLADLNQGVLTYALDAIVEGKPQGNPKILTFRGPDAPKALDIASELRGTVVDHDLESQSLGETRNVHVYIPPGNDPIAFVLYMADGQGTSSTASALEPLIQNKTLPRIAIVGAESGRYQGSREGENGEYDVTKDMRAVEYLPHINGERFEKHSQFFCKELSRWAEDRFDLPRSSDQRIVYGFSNGGRFAVTMGMRHGDHFRYAIGCSVAGENQPDDAYRSRAAFFLAAGKWEPAFLKNTEDLAKELSQANTQVRMVPRAAGHDFVMWQEELVSALCDIATKSKANANH